jgi:predicted RNA-binding protein YlxR (DUF448 family)
MTPAARNIPMRRCIACRESMPKRSLLRLVDSESGVRLDHAQRLPGRGSSICLTCAQAAVVGANPVQQKHLRRALARAFGAHAESAWQVLANLTNTNRAAPMAGPAASGPSLGDQRG